jgi:hypothetical protein
MAYQDSVATNTYRHRIATISGTTITLGTEQIQTEGTAGLTVNVVNICKVRNDCYATIVNIYNGTNMLDRLFISTVSGTVVTLAASIRSVTTNGYTLKIAYLSDNLLGIMEHQN